MVTYSREKHKLSFPLAEKLVYSDDNEKTSENPAGKTLIKAGKNERACNRGNEAGNGGPQKCLKINQVIFNMPEKRRPGSGDKVEQIYTLGLKLRDAEKISHNYNEQSAAANTEA